MADVSIFYVACLASYNNGTLRGCYVTPSKFDDGDQMCEAVEAYILRNEVVLGIDPGGFAAPVPYGAEEYLVHDFVDGPISQLASRLGEPSVSPQLWELCDLLDNHEHPEAFLAFVDQESIGLEDFGDAADRFTDAFMGHHDSVGDYVYSQYEAWDPDRAPERKPWDEGLPPLPSVLWNSINWDGVWTSEFDCSGWWTSSAGDGGVYIFSPQ